MDEKKSEGGRDKGEKRRDKKSDRILGTENIKKKKVAENRCGELEKRTVSISKSRKGRKKWIMSEYRNENDEGERR